MIIVSITTYKERENCCVRAIESILRQECDEEFKVVLVLSIEEYPLMLDSLSKELRTLIENKNIEVIWCDKDIRSSKKIIPTYKKYGNKYPIVVTDDDILRTEGWLQAIIDSYRKHPNCIIATKSFYEFNKHLCLEEASLEFNEYGRFIYNRTYASGLFGTLFPPNTFTDKRFFDINLLMKLSPTSDESWCFCFNTIENRDIYLIDKYFPLIYIKGSQTTTKTLKKINASNGGTNYDAIHHALFNEFPEYQENLSKRI